MKMKLFLAGLLVAASTSAAFAAGPYVGVSGGVAILHDNDVKVSGIGTATAAYETGYGFNIATGYAGENVRAEFEFGYKQADMEKLTGPGGSVTTQGVDVTVMSYMINGYYDFKNTTAVTPFIGVGVGVLNGELKDAGTKTTDTVFGYSLATGLAFKASENVNIDLTYRYVGAGSDFSKDGVSVAYGSSNITAGIRYHF